MPGAGGATYAATPGSTLRKFTYFPKVIRCPTDTMDVELQAPGVTHMSTKITGYGTPTTVVTGSTRTGGVERVAGDAPQSGPASSGGDSVTLTNSARTLQKLGDAIAAAPVVDGGRVESIKSQIAQNTYKVDSLKVAAKLLQADQELPNH